MLDFYFTLFLGGRRFFFRRGLSLLDIHDLSTVLFISSSVLFLFISSFSLCGSFCGLLVSCGSFFSFSLGLSFFLLFCFLSLSLFPESLFLSFEGLCLFLSFELLCLVSAVGLLPELGSLDSHLFLLTLRLLLLSGLGVLPLVGGDALVFVVNLVCSKVFLYLVILKVEINTNLVNLLVLEDRNIGPAVFDLLFDVINLVFSEGLFLALILVNVVLICGIVVGLLLMRLLWRVVVTLSCVSLISVIVRIALVFRLCSSTASSVVSASVSTGTIGVIGVLASFSPIAISWLIVGISLVILHLIF